VTIGKAGEGAVNATDRYATMLADLMRRVGNIERLGHVHPQRNWPHNSGDVISTIRSSAPDGWLLIDGTLHVGAATSMPDLWDAAPASWKVGSDLQFPDARGRVVMAAGTGAGLTARTLGTLVGVESVTLTAAQSGLPAHNHTQNSHTHTGVAHTHVQDAHTHTGVSHTHTQDAHTHTGIAHTHTQDAHNHTQNSHTHSEAAHTHSITHDHPSGTTGTVSSDHTHTFSGTTSGFSNSHTHGPGTGNTFITQFSTGSAGLSVVAGPAQPDSSAATTGWANQDHTHTYSGTTSGISANHSHSFDVANFTGNSGNASGTILSATTATNIAATATNQSTTAGVNSATATNQATTAGVNSATATNQSTTAGVNAATATNIASTAADAASSHTNVQPSLVLNLIVKI